MAGEERYDLWRKQGFICRPFSSEIKDRTRFLDDYLEQSGVLLRDLSLIDNAIRMHCNRNPNSSSCSLPG